MLGNTELAKRPRLVRINLGFPSTQYRNTRSKGAPSFGNLPASVSKTIPISPILVQMPWQQELIKLKYIFHPMNARECLLQKKNIRYGNINNQFIFIINKVKFLNCQLNLLRNLYILMLL